MMLAIDIGIQTSFLVCLMAAMAVSLANPDGEGKMADDMGCSCASCCGRQLFQADFDLIVIASVVPPLTAGGGMLADSAVTPLVKSHVIRACAMRSTLL